MVRVIRMEHDKLIACSTNNHCAGKQWFVVDGRRFVENIKTGTYLKTLLHQWCIEHEYPMGEIFDCDFQESLSVFHNKCYLVPVLKKIS